MYLVTERPPSNTEAWAPVRLAAENVDDAIAEAFKRHDGWKPGARTVLYYMDADGEMSRIAVWGV